MAALEDLRDLPLHRRHILGAERLRIQYPNHIHSGVILHQPERNQHRLRLNIRKPERFHALDKHADHGERQFAHAHAAANGTFRPKKPRRQLLGDQADFVAGFHVRRVEIPSAQNQQAANFLVTLRDPDQIHRPLHALRHHGHRQLAHARQLHHLRHGSADRFHIIQCQFVAQRLRFVRCLDHFDPHQIRAHALDLLQHESLAGQRDRHHQHNRSAADDHAERGQHGA